MDFKKWFILNESIQDITNLKYPPIIAKIMQEQFGKNAYLFARWFKEYRGFIDTPNNWWLQAMAKLREVSLYDLTTLYASTVDSEMYKKELIKLDIDAKDSYSQEELQEKRIVLAKQIRLKFLDNSFFSLDFIKDIMAGTLTDLAPYKKLTLDNARIKYDKKNVFKDRKPIISYANGYKWIDVGKRCYLIAKLMKNCGSAGLMSWDSDVTMIVLFDKLNKPHTVVSYSPNDHRISGDEGVASTTVKSKYNEYILNLADVLKANFDYNKSKSTLLKVQYLLKGKASDIKQINKPIDIYNSLFQFNMNGMYYYTNGNVALSANDLSKIDAAIKNKTIEWKNNQNNLLKNVFNHLNQPIINHDLGIKYIPLESL